jgi:hypothetical protein
MSAIAASGGSVTASVPDPHSPPSDRDHDLPTPEDRRWALLAAELPFEQLGHARAQAEGWRNALAVATTAVGAVSLFRGRDDVAALLTPWRVAAVVVFLLGFAALTFSFLLAIAAAHGRPGLLIDADGESLRDFVTTEAKRVTGLVRQAAYLVVAGIGLMVAAASVAWLAPVAPAMAAQPVIAVLDNGQACGDLVGIDAGQLVLMITAPSGAEARSIPMARVERLFVVRSC